MGFVVLQERLRRELRRRIAAGDVTGMELARKTGFTQAHISNFVNRKRGLKLGALDRMTKALGLTVYDLLDPHELGRHAVQPLSNEGEFTDVPLIDPSASMRPIIVRDHVREVLKFRSSFLDRLRAPAPGGRKSWTRLIAVQIDSKEAAAMWPEAGSRITLLVDRFYFSLDPYHSGRRNICLVQSESAVLARFVESCGAGLVLQPRNSAFAATLLPIARAEDVIVGRVAQISLKA